MINRSIVRSFPLVIILFTILFAFGGPSEVKYLPGGYEKEWKKVDSLIQKGLTKSALTLVESIYKKAKAESNHPQLVKALLHKARFIADMEEESQEKIIAQLEKEISTSPEPLKQILHSVLAEAYWGYYQNNRWRIYQRTETVNFKQEDIKTWDLRKIVQANIEHFQKSLANPEILKSTPIGKYDAILVKQKNSEKYRPTLYDFLAHRALEFYSGEEPSITRPAERFELTSTAYFSPAEEFSMLDISSTDTFAIKFHAIKLLRDLISFHLHDSIPDALVDADLIRLNFVKNNSVLVNKDSLYVSALLVLEKKNADYPISTEVTLKIAEFYFEESAKYDPSVSDKHKLDKKIAYEACESAIRRFPESAGAVKCRELQKVIQQPALAFQVERVNAIGAPFRSLISYTNVPQLYIRIVKAAADEQHRYDRRNISSDSAYKYYAAKTAIKTWSVGLPDDRDFQKHAAEIEIPALESGTYVILCSSNSTFVSDENSAASYGFANVSDLSFVSRSNTTSRDVYVLHGDKGIPLKGVTVQVWKQVYNSTLRQQENIKGMTYLTGENGYVQIPGITGQSGNYYLELIYKEDRLYTEHFYNYYYQNTESLETNIQFFTDRSIYRPGQTIYFKGIALETFKGKNALKKGLVSKVTLHDVNNEKVSELTLTTNEFGTFSGSFTAPVGRLTGGFSIQTLNGHINFQVEEYKRPKFEVTFEALKESYRLGEKVKVKGIAKTYSGALLDNSKLKYRVVRQAVYPYPGYRYYRMRLYPRLSTAEIANGEGITNEKGEFEITFDLIPDATAQRELSPVFNYIVTADVTDANGETRTTSKTVSAGFVSLIAGIDIPDMVNKEEENKLKISTTNLNGDPEPAKGKIIVFKLRQPEKVFRSRLWEAPDKYTMDREEYYRKFPFDLYADEDNKSKWEKDKIAEYAFDTEKSNELQPAFKEWKTGDYVMELETKDKFGQEVKLSKYFVLFSTKEKQMPLKEIAWFHLIEKNVKPGGTARLMIGTADKDLSLLYEVIQNGISIVKVRLMLNNEQQLIEIPVPANNVSNLSVHLVAIKHGRSYIYEQKIHIEPDNKLVFEYETFRDKLLPGEKEEWRIKIKGEDGKKYASEVVAAMYDMSLDAFMPHAWDFYVPTHELQPLQWNMSGTGVNGSIQPRYPGYYSPYGNEYDRLNTFGYYIGSGMLRRDYRRSANIGYKDEAGSDTEQMKVGEGDAAAIIESAPAGLVTSKNKNQAMIKDTIYFTDLPSGDPGTVQARTNFSETAFFYPQLKTNDSGDLVISFTMPDALTRWKFLALAHTKDLRYGLSEKQLITQKQLMVSQNAPRFFRENDNITFTAKVSNLTDSGMSGSAKLFLYDALSMKPLVINSDESKNTLSFSAKASQSAALSWNFTVPEGVQAITYKVVATAGNYSDGEEMTAPVLSNRMLVTESLPLPVRGMQTKNFEFSKLLNPNSTTLKNHRLTLEYTSNPAWYAIQALPYLMEYPYECSEQIFSRYYANSIATHIANSGPKIKQVFESWKNLTPDALLSNLEKNQELKSALLEETPWVLQSQNEAERKKRLALLFDLNRMSNELSVNLNKLQQAQLPGGGWPWFKGMRDDRYITQHIVTGLGHLDHLGIKNIRSDKQTWRMISEAVNYTDQMITEDYMSLPLNKPEEMSKQQISAIQIQYLYARSYFKDLPVKAENKKAFDYYLAQAGKYWLQQNRYLQGMTALALKRYAVPVIPSDIIKSLKENALTSEEMGMYWKDNSGGYYWQQAPIETQALLIEAFDEVAKDMRSVEEMKIWLLKQKQTQDWKTTKATAEACYALLLRGANVLGSQKLVEITLGSMKIDPLSIEDAKVEAGTGYFKTSWSGSDIKPEMGKVTVSKKDSGVAWGALYWQYFEQLDKITPSQTPLQLTKKLFLQKASAQGPVITPVDESTKLQPGDRLIVRIELKADRDMEYIHMKDMRAAALEPENVISGYRYQDGLGYYQSTRDVSTNFFISWLPKGTYVFEYPVRVTHEGNFSNGITSIQCMYAPEFSAHSEGIRIQVGK